MKAWYPCRGLEDETGIETVCGVIKCLERLTSLSTISDKAPFRPIVIFSLSLFQKKYPGFSSTLLN